eukprot:Phypoly_transcript_18838.p1 GENE.Phypoly_transcript_18838~~Phypoly_transcript_18838.p1  ORF type:complete len:147 (+),score=18.78 Phypoly_transcript_18838:249-689(+)
MDIQQFVYRFEFILYGKFTLDSLGAFQIEMLYGTKRPYYGICAEKSEYKIQLLEFTRTPLTILATLDKEKKDLIFDEKYFHFGKFSFVQYNPFLFRELGFSQLEIMYHRQQLNFKAVFNNKKISAVRTRERNSLLLFNDIENPDCI